MAKGFKTGGRQLGQPNKLTAEVRELLGEIVKQELQNLPELLRKMEPKDRGLLLEKFTGYVIPKMQPEESTDPVEPIIIQISDAI